MVALGGGVYEQRFTATFTNPHQDGAMMTTAPYPLYCLRHYAITLWLRRIPVHVVQCMAGHKALSTTPRYVHFRNEDLEEAARRLGVGSSTLPPTSPAA